MTKPYLCGICGETDPIKFKKGSKGKCAACQKIYNKEKAREKDSEIRGMRMVLRRIKSQRTEIKRLVRAGIKEIPKPPKVLDYGRKSQKYFEETVIANHGDMYLFDKTVYHGSNKEVEVGCKKHGNYFKLKAITLLRRTIRNGGKEKNPKVGSCPICREEYFASIKDDIISKCRQAHNNEYEYGEHVNMNTPLKINCKIHGWFEVMPRTHSEGGGKCPECYPIYAWGNKPNPKIKYIGEQKYYICDIHGDVPIGKNRHGTEGCPTCNTIENNRIREEVLRENLEKKFGREYDIFLTENFVEFRCKKHGTRTTHTRAELREKRKLSHHCDDCRAEAKIQHLKDLRAETNVRCKEMLLTEYKNQYEFIEFMDENVNVKRARIKILNLLNNEEKIVRVDTVLKKMLSKDIRYLLRSYLNYDEAKERVKLLGITDFRQYKKWYVRTQQTELPTNPQRHYVGKGWISYNDFFGNNENDQMSAGEKRVCDYLQRKTVKYEYQKRYDDCRNINPLPFDFYLPEYNTIIEFDGYQHYFEVKRFKTSLKDTQKHDAIKNKYCQDNGINLLRIPYWELEDNTVEWTLDNELTRIAAENVVVKT